ncbi:MAG: hypothetical protein V4632_12505 [Pseudomonadota bacterium]
MGQSYILIGVAALLVSLVAWSWLTASIWKINPFGAILTFFTGLPAFYYLVKYWNDDELNIRTPFFTNLGLTVAGIILGVAFAVHQARAERNNTDSKKPLTGSDLMLERWCREKNDAVYSPGLGTCVEAEPHPANATQKAGSNDGPKKE